MTCASGEICVVEIIGALFASCMPNPCTGAVTCECVCGEPCGPEFGPGTPDAPLGFTCDACDDPRGCP